MEKLKNLKQSKEAENHEYIQLNSSLEVELTREQTEKESLFRKNKLLTEEINQLTMQKQ